MKEYPAKKIEITGIVASLPLPRNHEDGMMHVFSRGLSICGSEGGNGVRVRCMHLSWSASCMPTVRSTRSSHSNPNALANRYNAIGHQLPCLEEQL